MTAATLPPIKEDMSHERLGFTLCLALALHAVVILGITFASEDRKPKATTLDITLAQHRSDVEPDKADFLAQENQLGSGTLEHKAELTTTAQQIVPDTAINPTNQPAERRAIVEHQPDKTLISTTAQSRFKAPSVRESELQQQTGKGSDDYDQLTQQIASLEAKLDIQQQLMANRPRIRRITSVSTKRAEDALYSHNWERRIESVGNQNYPEEAKRRGLYGDLRLLVALLPNGEINNIELLKSSGHPLLDQAAIQIVRLAAPYAPFPAEFRDKVDVLEIIRTWRFHKDTLISQ